MLQHSRLQANATTRRSTGQLQAAAATIIAAE
jgi:hypothetical protein